MAKEMRGHSSVGAAMRAHPEMARMMAADPSMAKEMRGHSSVGAAMRAHPGDGSDDGR